MILKSKVIDNKEHSMTKAGEKLIKAAGEMLAVARGEIEPASVTLGGRTSFHSETGTEGGYWAFQDGAWIKPNTTRFYCFKCNMYWDKSRDNKEPTFSGNYCQPGEHDFQLISKEDWDYEGLHLLEDGDELSVFDKGTTLWSGVIKLRQFPLFTENVFGFWIHSEQIDVDREWWAELFMTPHEATLRPKRKAR